MLPKILLFLFFTAAVYSPPTRADDRPYYMWTDEEGVLNFSQIAPPNIAAEEILVEKPLRFGYPEPAEDETQALETEDDSFAEVPLPPIATSEGDIDSASLASINARIRSDNCTSARRTLDKLVSMQTIMVHGEDGFWREVSDEVRAAEIERAQAAINENCTS